MVKLIILSGAQGTGKTSVAKELAKLLIKAGQTVWSANEMSFDLPYGVGMSRQLAFRQQIEIRNSMIRNLIWFGYGIEGPSRTVDYVILDRDVVDIDLYTMNILNSYSLDTMDLDSVEYNHFSDIDTHHYFLTRHKEQIMVDMLKRLDGEPDRADWAEDNMEYLENILALFNAYADEWGKKIIHNKHVVKTVNYILGDIYG